MKVVVVGAAGGIGQPLSLLVKQNPLVTDLALYDVAPAAGVAADVSHVDARSTVTGYTGDQLPAALAGADLVVIPAGVPRKPGMTRDDLFGVNAGIIQGIAAKIAVACPKAMVCVITNPVNSTVPIVAETLKAAGVFDPRKLCGVTTLDLMRSRAFIGERLGRNPKDVELDVIGGHSGTTIVPILSTLAALPQSEHAALTVKIQNAGSVVVEAKAGKGSATLSMAAAAAHFVGRLLSALSGEVGVRECAYVAQSAVPGIDYLALPCTFGPRGVEVIHDVTGDLVGEERARAMGAIKTLQGQIQKGIGFAKSKL